MKLTDELSGVRTRLGEADFRKYIISSETRELPEEEWELHVVTGTLIDMLHAVGVDRVTEENVDDIAARLVILQLTMKPVLTFRDTPIYLTAKDVHRHIGLTTDASTLELGKFLEDVYDGVREGNGLARCAAGGSAHFLVEVVRKVLKS